MFSQSRSLLLIASLAINVNAFTISSFSVSDTKNALNNSPIKPSGMSPISPRASTISSFVSSTSHLNMNTSTKENEKEETNEDFWEKQKKLVADMNDFVDEGEKAVKETQRSKYNKKVSGLVSETFYFSILIFSTLWLFLPNPFTPISYFLGAALGTAYCFGLGKSVESLGGSAYDIEDVKGSGVGSARFAFLIVLIIFVGKFRSQGLQEIPAIMGFFTYQLASLSQGLKEASDD